MRPVTDSYAAGVAYLPAGQSLSSHHTSWTTSLAYKPHKHTYRAEGITGPVAPKVSGDCKGDGKGAGCLCLQWPDWRDTLHPPGVQGTANDIH